MALNAGACFRCTSTTLLHFRQLRNLGLGLRQFTSRGKPTQEYSEEEYAAARKWQATFGANSISKDLATTRFDRSSGKGGQHVNKTNSKATTSWPLSSIAQHLPPMIVKELRASRYYSKNSDALIIQSQEGRVQRDNEEDTHRKLQYHIVDIAKKIIPGETTAETKEKHAKQEKAANAARLRVKKQHSDKKQSRSGRSADY